VPFDRTLRTTAAVAAFAIAGLVQSAPHADEAGAFDFYLLSLSWSPTYCAQEGEPSDAQCALPDPDFIVHGLWPQHESGYPEYCDSDESNWVARETIDAVRDIMPSGGLVGHQWRKHGMCSGLSDADYFSLVRHAYGSVVIPESLDRPEIDRRLSPDDIEDAFAAANEGLEPDHMSVQCRDGAFTEIRICMTKDLQFRRCEEVDAETCGANSIAVPSARQPP
jgi:ribonuclease T2